MKQAYEAVDKIDGLACYFFFDGVGGYTALMKSIVGSKENALNYFKNQKQVIGPILVIAAQI